MRFHDCCPFRTLAVDFLGQPYKTFWPRYIRAWSKDGRDHLKARCQPGVTKFIGNQAMLQSRSLHSIRFNIVRAAEPGTGIVDPYSYRQ
jgi:hypothetical protein